MNNLIKNYIYNILYQLFIIIVPLFTAPYLARILGATQLGIYSYINSISTIITTVGLIGLNNYGIRQIAYIRNNKSKLFELFYELMILRIVLCIITTIIYLIFIIYSPYKRYFILQYFLILATFLDISWLFIGIENMKIVVFRNFIAKFINVISIFIFVRKENDLWIYIFSFSMITLITTISLYKKLDTNITKTDVKFKNIYKHIVPSIRLLLPQVSILLYMQLDKVMIKVLTNGTDAIAFYDQGQKIIMIPLALITALSTVMMPRLANEFCNKNFENMNNYLYKIIRFSLFAAIPMTIGIASISSNLIPWYLGKEFYSVINIIIILSPTIIINSLANISGNQFFTATNQTNIMTIAYASSAIINIIINYFFIPIYGYIGATFANLFSSTIAVIIQYYYLNKQVKIYKAIKSGFKYLFVSLIMGLIIVFLGTIMASTIITTSIQIIFGIFIYLGILALIKDEMFIFILNKILKSLDKLKFFKLR